MNIEVSELQALVHRGGRAAYEVEHHFADDPPFEEWLRGPNMISRLTEQCQRVLDGDQPYEPELEEMRAIRIALAALNGVSELEQLASMAAAR